MTLQEALNLTPEELNSLTLSELKPIVQQLGHSVRGRVQSFKKSEARGDTVYSPAVKALEKTGGAIHTKGLNLNQLRAEYKRARNFLSYKTSTVKEARVYREDMLNKLGFDQTATKDEIREAWDMFHKLQETYPAELMRQAGAEYYKKYIQAAGDAVKNGDTLEEFMQRADELYEAMQAENADIPEGFYRIS